MVVGVKDVPLRELEARMHDFKELDKYVRSLVPIAVRHNKLIVDNQKYIAACCLKKSKRDYYAVKAATDYLTKHVSVTGLCDVVTEFNEVLNYVDLTLIEECLREDGL